jgi:hypothetical protein
MCTLLVVFWTFGLTARVARQLVFGSLGVNLIRSTGRTGRPACLFNFHLRRYRLSWIESIPRLSHTVREDVNPVPRLSNSHSSASRKIVWRLMLRVPQFF